MFSEKDSYLLQELAKKCRDAKERERLRALYALSVGYSIEKVAEIFCIDETTLYRWMEKWQGEECLSDKPKKGRPNSLSEEDKRKIKDLILEGNPRKHGIDSSTWNTKELRDYFLKEGKCISQETIRRCLKDMGARYVRTKQAYSEEDKKAWEDFVRVLISTMNYDPKVIYPLFEKEVPLGTCKNYGWMFEKRRIAKESEQDDTEEQDAEGQDEEDKDKKKESSLKKSEKYKEIEPIIIISGQD